MNSILSGVTSEIIQQYLEENEQLIMAILQNRNTGKEAECAVLEVRLQRNLTYLAAVADCQDEMQATAQTPPGAGTQLAPPPPPQFRMPAQPPGAGTQLAPPPQFRMPAQPPGAGTQLAPPPPPQFMMPAQPPGAGTQLAPPPPPQFRMPAQIQQLIPQSIRIPPSTRPRALQQLMPLPRSGVNTPFNMPLVGGQSQRSGSTGDRPQPAPSSR